MGSSENYDALYQACQTGDFATVKRLLPLLSFEELHHRVEPTEPFGLTPRGKKRDFIYSQMFWEYMGVRWEYMGVRWEYMGVHGSTVGVHGSTMGVQWEYMGVR
jgi:hypothetical protein